MGVFHLVKCLGSAWGAEYPWIHWMLSHVGSPAEVPRGVHRRGGGSGLPVREDFLTIRTYSQISVESSPSPEYSSSVYNHVMPDLMLLASPTRLKAPF